MPRKNYKQRITDGLKELRDYEDGHGGDRLFDQESRSKDVGQIFQVVSDTTSHRPADHPIARLFREANLNFFDPYDWDYLLGMMARVHYDDRKKGRPKQQDSAFKRRLSRHVNRILAGKQRQPNDQLLATLFLEKYRREYPGVKTVSGVRALLTRHGLLAADRAATAAKRGVATRVETSAATAQVKSPKRPKLGR